MHQHDGQEDKDGEPGQLPMPHMRRGDKPPGKDIAEDDACAQEQRIQQVSHGGLPLRPVVVRRSLARLVSDAAARPAPKKGANTRGTILLPSGQFLVPHSLYALGKTCQASPWAGIPGPRQRPLP
ncbi:hypothetical protein [Cupriavidus lacunae]|uniref:hypothetical protein n=1 Tax=Cupriavidus lacunae TaxID=2666307 RepID=UPI001FC9E37E|nr:hypothetical protein [Cupriavidus lacunae]